MAKNSTTFPLPLELLTDITQLLPLPDQRSLSLTSQLTRNVALRFVFGHLRYTENVLTKIHNIHLAGKDVKVSITKLELVSHYTPKSTDDERNTLFQFLESLPNLRSFSLIQALYLVPPTDIPQLIASLRHASLLEFSLAGFTAKLEGQPIIGPSGLEKLSVKLNLSDGVDTLANVHDHTYDLVRPSLSTLVDLEIDHRLGPNFDLQLLKPAGSTLRSFKYLAVRNDQSILDHIPVLFPHLIKLDIQWSKYMPTKQPILWKDEHIDTLARIKNLTDLTLSYDFEVESNDIFNDDENFAWYVRSYKRRLKATQDVLSACEKLERCCWIQIHVRQRTDLNHSFVVEERALDGKKTKMVRGLKQVWMGRDYYCLETGGIVRCKFEDLPGDIIGENDPPWTYEDELHV